MKAVHREMDRYWRPANNDHYRTMIELEELAEIYCQAGTPEVMAARTCRRGGCRRARTCGRPQTCSEPAMLDHRNLLEIEAEMRAGIKVTRGEINFPPRGS
jgi:hypothetical protein